MGKTMQTIATILDNRPKLQHAKPGTKHAPSCSADEKKRLQNEDSLWAEARKQWKDEMLKNEVPEKLLKKKGGERAGTLVICPVIALMQWKAEIEKFTEEGALSVGIYHGPNRTSEMPLAMMPKYDIILTTYQVLEQDYRKMVSPNKVTCPNCGHKYKIDKLKVHLKYFCGETAQRTEAQARQRRTAERLPPSQSRRTPTRSIGSKKIDVRRVTPEPKMETSGRASKYYSQDSDEEPTRRNKYSKQPKRNEYSRVVGTTSLSDESSQSDSSSEVAPVRRPSRRATKTTLRKISSSVRESTKGPKSNYEDGDDDSDFIDFPHESESESEGVTTESEAEEVPLKRKIAAKKSDKASSLQGRKKQRIALENTHKKKGKKNQVHKPKKKFPNESSSSESDALHNEGEDALEGIDMDFLLEEAMAGSRLSPLHSFCWWRVVLDEAHYIKSRSSQTAAAAFALSGIHRWCLSGTPLQNRVGELYSLIRFLRLEPMAYYFCRQCDCKSIHYRMKDGKCQDCDHRTFSHFAHFNKYVLNPIQRDGYSGDGRRAMFLLKNEVLDKCLLRRTKENRAADMCLPPRIVSIKTIRLHPIEQDFYDSLYMQTRASFDDYVAEGTLLNNYAHIFDLLTKMRQAVDHPYLIVYNKKNMKKTSVAVSNGEAICDLCSETPTERIVSSCCEAGFCRACVTDYLSSSIGENLACPSCERPFSIDLNQASVEVGEEDAALKISPEEQVQYALPTLRELPHVPMSSILRRISLANFTTSSKIEALVKELTEMRQFRPGSKALVFSQFVNMLDLIRWRIHTDPMLTDLGLGVRLLHGGMDVKSRNQTLKEFREDTSVRILLMSLKAGGVALNLTVASEVYLVDNWWNPAAEMQAIDRTHRLGQHRPIRAVRFIAEGTVEERVLQLQEKKRLVFDGTVGRDAGSLKMLTVDDMKALFSTM